MKSFGKCIKVMACVLGLSACSATRSVVVLRTLTDAQRGPHACGAWDPSWACNPELDIAQCTPYCVHVLRKGETLQGCRAGYLGDSLKNQGQFSREAVICEVR
ncbi:MAG TPA: hypothetical protein VHM70_01065 [Polyangiaceae bacterium]|nr:hypothetical protein [Polyangiaceae bacterium]